MAPKKPVQKTHQSVSPEFVGKVESIETGRSARVTLVTTRDMQADSKGLVHGGFTFSLADYAAMLAVNHPFVVLLASDVRFMKPVSVGDKLTASAKVTDTADRTGDGWLNPTDSSRQSRISVLCEVTNQNGTKVFEGEFLCMVLERHVLER